MHKFAVLESLYGSFYSASTEDHIVDSITAKWWVSKDMEGNGRGLEGTSLLIRRFPSGNEENKSKDGRCSYRNSKRKPLQGYCCTKLLISAFETSINN
jgi:hypothetical protein